MLYYIIPPVIIIVVLAVLVLFLSRKSSAIQEEIERGQSEEEMKKKLVVTKINRLSLGVLEKGMYRLKLVFLKSYNTFDAWVKSIRKKREHQAAKIAAIEDQVEKQRENEAEFLEEKKEAPEEIISIQEVEPEIPIMKTELVKDVPEADGFIRPSLRRRILETVVETETAEELKIETPPIQTIEIVPKAEKRPVRETRKKIEKSALESALIERIAENPKDLEAYERLGAYYVENKNFPDALECFKQVLKFSPGNRKAKTQLKKLEKQVLGW
jgi:tetratricopeptide (TPR) repeat protein